MLMPVRSWTSSAPSGHLPRARGRLRDLLRSCSAEGNGPERRDVFRLEARSDCPQGWGPTPKVLRSGCQNAAAGGETSLLHAADWVTFSCALKPECISQRPCIPPFIKQKCNCQQFPYRPCGPLPPKGEALLRARARGTMLDTFCELVSFACHPPMDPFRPYGPLSPCAGYDACKYSQSSHVDARPLMDLFRPFGAPSPCAGKARDLLRSCSAEGNGPKRRDVFRLEARGDCP